MTIIREGGSLLGGREGGSLPTGRWEGGRPEGVETVVAGLAMATQTCGTPETQVSHRN